MVFQASHHHLLTSNVQMTVLAGDVQVLQSLSRNLSGIAYTVIANVVHVWCLTTPEMVAAACT